MSAQSQDQIRRPQVFSFQPPSSLSPINRGKGNLPRDMKTPDLIQVLTSYGWPAICCELAISLATRRLSNIETEICRSFQVPLAILIEATWKCGELQCESLEECLRFLSAATSELKSTPKTSLLEEEMESLLSIYDNELVVRESFPTSGVIFSLELSLSKYSSIDSLPSFLSHWSSSSDQIVLEVRK